MTVVVVEILEQVEVDHDQRHRMAGALGAPEYTQSAGAAASTANPKAPANGGQQQR
jgi:hypothetical protein